MTATSAGSSSCLAAKGLDISLAALQRQDPYINNIVDVASQVALYTYNNRSNEWEKTEVEGTLFIYTRLASPRHGFTIMNRLSMENLTEPITKHLDFQLQDPFLLYRNARLVIHGIWFYDKEDCQRIAQRMKILTQQEQVLAQSQGGWLSPKEVVGGGEGRGEGQGGSDGKGVDIIQMLTKARTEYNKEKSTSEPKEIGGSSVLYGNPNLIKPIPVKPNTQDNERTEPKPLSLATLFGPQHACNADPVSPVAVAGTGSSTGKVVRPPVARTLTYEDAVKSGTVTSQKAVVCSDGGIAVAVVEQRPNQSQHCPAIQKLMQGQRGVGGALHTVSESPENRLCDNGVALEHQHHSHHLYHHQHHHHHQHQQLPPDPIQRLFQGQPASSLPQQQNPHPTSHPIILEPVSCSHLQPHQKQQLFFSLSNPQREAQHNSQSTLTAQGTGLLPALVINNQDIQPLPGQSCQMPGVVSPHELLQKLQLVQQEQNQGSPEPSRPCPGLAPRFLGATQSQSGVGQIAGSVPNPVAATVGQKAAQQFQVISPQRIPATVAPTLLLSPSAFSQAKSGGGLSAVGQESSPAPLSLSRPSVQEESRVLSKSQLQVTLLHLIQNDSSFLDSIYQAYISRFANDSSSKY